MTRKKVELTPQDEAIFSATRSSGNLDIFSEHYFRLPYSGTRFTPTERPDEYQALWEAWKALGKPDEQFEVRLNDELATIKLIWEQGTTDPTLLYHHGYLFLPWVKEMWVSGKPIIVVEGGTGSGKTSGVGLFALTLSALTPAYEFLNVAPTGTQAADMIEEVEKWVTGTPFERFIVRPRSGELYTKRPYPEYTINIGGQYNSIFGCMTLGQHGNWVLGKGKDWVSVDEAGLVPDIDTVIPKLVTRVRATRKNGMTRDARISFISNPHKMPGWRYLVKRAEKLNLDPQSRYFFARPHSSDNPAITESQLGLHEELIDNPADRARWLLGDPTSVEQMGEFPPALMDLARDISLEAIMEDRLARQAQWTDGERKTIIPAQYVTRDGVGVIHWSLPPVDGMAYITIGDPGQANKNKLRINNVPVVLSFDVTNFPAGPAKLCSYHLIDGGGRYGPWKDQMRQSMRMYPGLAAYDATATQIAFVEDDYFRGTQLWPVSLGGGVKGLSKALLKLLLGDGLIAMPYLSPLWFEAAIYQEGHKKQADDIMSCLFILAFVLKTVYAADLGNKYADEDRDSAEKALDDIYIAGARRGDGRYERRRRYGDTRRGR